MSRREFLRRAAEMGVGAVLASVMLELLGPMEALAAIEAYKPVRFQKKLPANKAQCLVCPFNCKLVLGEVSQCLTKVNRAGKVMTFAFNNPSIISVDPIEKMPLYHYRPGAETLSLAVGGCNLHCIYCQNWQESQKSSKEQRTTRLTGADAMKALKKKDLHVLAYNYTEPVVFLEWIEILSAAAARRKIPSVAGTGAYINKKPLKHMCRYVDAFVVGLKGFTEEFYRKVTGASLRPVLDALVTIKEEDKHLEVVTLIVPTHNDDMKKIKELVRWVKKNLGEDTPLHFSRFVPMYKLRNLPQTPLKTLENARKAAQDAGLRYVYIVNLSPHPGNDTYCHKCKKPLIKRVGLKILRNDIKDGKCPHCGAKIPGVWDETE